MTRRFALALVVLAMFVLAAPALARQAAAPPAGQWVGTLPAGPGLEMEFNLASKGGAWHGTISVPQQGTKGLPLGEVTVKGKTIVLVIKGAPGDPRYSGTLSDDGKTITGEFTQGGGSLPLTLAWKGEPKFPVPEKSTPITKDLEGAWEGVLDVNGKTLRLRLTLANGPSGATGMMVSVDQNNAEIPISTITQDKTKVRLLIMTISGAYEGELKDGEIAGTWTQGPLSRPLVFKRSK
jgi:hypothetical protein